MPPPTTATEPPSESRSSSTISLRTTVLAVFFILIAFFPGLFHLLWSIPLALLTPSTYIPHASPKPSPLPHCIPPQQPPSMSWYQKTFSLPAKSRGSYLVTDAVLKELPEIKDYKIGMLNLFIQHTSCALSLNENWDSDVREDMSDALDRIAPEDRKGDLYRHSAEGLDDMPGHIKSALIGVSVTIPISNGKLALGTWQGIHYLEFRSSKHKRSVVATIQGQMNS